MIERSASSLLRGSLVADLIGNPAAQANFDWEVPMNYNIEVQYIVITLTADATAGNRYLMLEFVEPAGAIMWRSSPVFAQLPSTARTYYASQSSAPNTLVYANGLQLALPPRNMLRNSWHIRSYMDAPAVGDQLSAIRIAYIRHTCQVA
jgi:hypothetical protein